MEEILKECTDIIDEICNKYGYDIEEKEGNASLRTVLLKAIPAMLKDVNLKDRELFYQMLRHTPIVITENLTQESYDKLEEKYIGNINSHIIEEEMDTGEYGKDLGAGAYVSAPIIDENLHLQGKKSFIYIQRVEGKAKEFLGTDINVPHLIHELGHAWHSEKDEFVMQEDKTMKRRVGTAEFIYTFQKGKDNKYMQRNEKVTGLMLEEGMNTIAEEQAMANYIGISLEDIKEKYKEFLIPSNYQGYISYFVSDMLQQLGKSECENWRLHGDLESKSKIEELMSRTKYWENRETDILPSSDSPRNYNRKRDIISQIDKPMVQEFFSKYQNVYFPDISQMTPLEKIDNVLTQSFNMNMVRYSMGIDKYKDFLNCLGYEGYSLINQAGDLRKKDELHSTISDVKLSEVEEITQGTRKINNIDKEKEGEKSR